MKKNRLKIFHIIAITIALIMLISGAALGDSSFDKDGSESDNRFTENFAKLDGGAIFFDIDDHAIENTGFTEN